MLKIKYLHRKSRPRNSNWDIKKYKKIKNINVFSELPLHESFRSKHKWSNLDMTPLKEFLESKIGCNWNDVYSEIISKTKKNMRYSVDDFIRYCVVIKPIYDDEFIPMMSNGRKYFTNNLTLENRLFVDMNNILVRKNKEELLIDSKKYIRKMKIQQILENMKSD
jgi:hypothetical protein